MQLGRQVRCAGWLLMLPNQLRIRVRIAVLGGFAQSGRGIGAWARKADGLGFLLLGAHKRLMLRGGNVFALGLWMGKTLHLLQRLLGFLAAFFHGIEKLGIRRNEMVGGFCFLV